MHFLVRFCAQDVKRINNGKTNSTFDCKWKPIKNEMSRAKRVKEQKDGEKSYEIVKRGKMQQEIEKMQISFI